MTPSALADLMRVIDSYAYDYKQGGKLAPSRKAVERALLALSAPAAETEAVQEAVAKAIYAQWESQPGYKPWVEGGNSLMQDKARDIARAAVPVAPKAEQEAFGFFVPKHDGSELLHQVPKLYAKDPRYATKGRWLYSAHLPVAPKAEDLDAMLTRILNRRVVVEQALFDMAAGKKPLPDADRLRELALQLGDPAFPAAPKAEPDVNLILRDVCEAEEDDPENPETLCISREHLETILRRHIEGVE